MRGPTCIFWANLTPSSLEGGRAPLLLETAFDGAPELLGDAQLVAAGPSRWEIKDLQANASAIVHTRGAADFVVGPLRGDPSQYNYYGWGAAAQAVTFGEHFGPLKGARGP